MFYVASRGHHADVGGLTPASMPPHSTHIDDEGLLVTNFHLVKRGVLQSKALRALLGSGPNPPRAPATNEADVRAQIAANERGIAELRRLCNRHSLPQVRRYMRHVQVSSIMQSSALRVPLSLPVHLPSNPYHPLPTIPTTTSPIQAPRILHTHTHTHTHCVSRAPVCLFSRYCCLCARQLTNLSCDAHEWLMLLLLRVCT